MDIIVLFDLTNIILIALGIITILLTGFMSKYINLYKSFIFSLISIFVGGFLIANIITSINQMRIVVLSLVFFVIFPWIISYTITWTFSEKTTNVREKIGAFAGWWIGLIIISTIRLLFGWGFDSIWVLILLGILISILNGILGGIIGNYLISKAEKINPTK
jgi:hypothetical protein